MSDRIRVLKYAIAAFLVSIAVLTGLTPFLVPSTLPEGVGPAQFTREIFFNIEPVLTLVFYAIAGFGLGGLLIGIYDNALIWARGRKEDRFSNLGWRLWGALGSTTQNRAIVKRDHLAGVMHFTIMWGIIVLFVGTVLLSIHDRIVPFLFGVTYLVYDLVLDFFAAILIFGVLLALYRRYVIRPRKLGSVYDDRFILSTLLIIGVTGLLIEGLRLAITKPEWEYLWAPLGFAFGSAFFGMPETLVKQIHFGIWWVHVLVTFSLIAYLPFSKLFHVFASTANVVFRSQLPKGSLPSLPQELEGGIKDVSDLTWKRLMDLDACTICGRCTDSCPATASGRVLSPMHLIQNLKAAAKAKYGLHARIFRSETSQPIVDDGGFVSPEELWGCTTCRACMEVCPVNVEHVYDIVDLRRRLIEEGKAPESAMKVLNNMHKFGNSYGQPQAKRADWAKGLGIKDLSEGGTAEVLLFVGCLASFDARAQKIVQALAKVLQLSGIDFAILGKEEICNGHEARRIGEEGLFEDLSEKNIQTFRKKGVKKIITISPHCYNAFRNDYPERGFRVEVQHYTQLLVDLIDSGRVAFTKKTDVLATFHDPCYLGRHNEEYEAPRKVLSSIPGMELKEMKRCRTDSFCCGGGGGGYWIEVEHQNRRMSEIRMDEASEISPEVVATACPFCLLNFDDAIKTTGREKDMNVKDVIELVAESL